MHICHFIQRKPPEISLNVAKSFVHYYTYCTGEGEPRLRYSS